MTADTVHLVAQLIRHQRAMMTSIEKWAGKQPASPMSIELAAAAGFMRQVLDTYEWQLGKVDTQSSEEPEKVGQFRR